MKTHRRPLVASVVIAGFVALTLALCTGGASVSASERNRRNGQLHATKECSPVHGHCRILLHDHVLEPPGDQGRIEIFYDQAGGVPTGMLDSNIVLDAGDGDRAVGRCTLDFATGLGLCTFSDGTGRLAGPPCPGRCLAPGRPRLGLGRDVSFQAGA